MSVKYSYINVAHIDFGEILPPTRGATTAEKLRGTKVWVPMAGPGVGFRKGVAPSRCESPGVALPGNF